MSDNTLQVLFNNIKQYLENNNYDINDCVYFNDTEEIGFIFKDNYDNYFDLRMKNVNDEWQIIIENDLEQAFVANTSTTEQALIASITLINACRAPYIFINNQQNVQGIPHNNQNQNMNNFF